MVKGKALDPDLITLVKCRLRDLGSQAKVLKEINKFGSVISKSSVSRIAGYLKHGGKRQDEGKGGKRGRPKAVTRREERRVLRSVGPEKVQTSEDLRVACGLSCSSRTLRRYLARMTDIKRIMPPLFVLQKEGDEARRQKWAAGIIAKYTVEDSRRIFAYDEKVFYLRKPVTHQKVYINKHKPLPRQDRRIGGGPAVHIMVGISKDGITSPVMKEWAWNSGMLSSIE